MASFCWLHFLGECFFSNFFESTSLTCSFIWLSLQNQVLIFQSKEVTNLSVRAYVHANHHVYMSFSVLCMHFVYIISDSYFMQQLLKNSVLQSLIIVWVRSKEQVSLAFFFFFFFNACVNY